MLAIPAAFTLSALGLMIYDHFTRLDPVALTLAMATIMPPSRAPASPSATYAGSPKHAARRSPTISPSMPNRRHFLRRVSDAIVASRATGTSLALLLLDLDHFKELNDTLGHDAGDQLLCQVGERLHEVLRASRHRRAPGRRRVWRAAHRPLRWRTG